MAAQSQRESNHERRRSQIVDVVRAQGGFELNAIGGEYVPEFSSFVGPQSIRALRDIHYVPEVNVIGMGPVLHQGKRVFFQGGANYARTAGTGPTRVPV